MMSNYGYKKKKNQSRSYLNHLVHSRSFHYPDIQAAASRRDSIRCNVGSFKRMLVGYAPSEFSHSTWVFPRLSSCHQHSYRSQGHSFGPEVGLNF